MAKSYAPAALRNSQPILEVIRDEFTGCRKVLEIGSGTGEHAVFFASEMPWLTWQTSDLTVNHDSIIAWIDDAGLDNVRGPLELDVQEPPQIRERYDAVFSANTAHIMSIGAVECMFQIVADCLNEDGRFCLYGPFNLNGAFTSDSNRQFDASLQARNPEMGIRDLETLDSFGSVNGMHRINLYAMPANNMIAVWARN